jgi:NTE family protein
VRHWLGQELAKLGVETFADLKLSEPWADGLPSEQAYKLVVIAADVTRGEMVRLPWDYPKYGLDPDKQNVADAVRASMSIPFYYEPVKMAGSVFVDGGLLSNFPIGLFDDRPDWPTFGIKLSMKREQPESFNPVSNLIGYTRSILGTLTDAHDQMHLDDPCVLARTMFVDTSIVSAVDFDITKEQQQELYNNGRKGAEKFLATWDYDNYLNICPPAKH